MMNSWSLCRSLLVWVLWALLVAGNSSEVTPMLAASAGHIYISVASRHAILRVDDMTGAGWTTLGNWGSGGGEFNEPGGIVVDGAGRIYVADSGNRRIVRVNDMAGTGWITLGAKGAGINEFANPHGVFVDAAGRIYVADLG